MAELLGEVGLTAQRRNLGKWGVWQRRMVRLQANSILQNRKRGNLDAIHDTVHEMAKE